MREALIGLGVRVFVMAIKPAMSLPCLESYLSRSTEGLAKVCPKGARTSSYNFRQAYLINPYPRGIHHYPVCASALVPQREHLPG